MERKEQTPERDATEPQAAAEADPRAEWRSIRDRLDRPEAPEAQDLESLLMWAEKVSRIFDELAGDPEFDRWFAHKAAEIERDPQLQAHAARDRERFLAMLKTQDAEGAEGAAPSDASPRIRPHPSDERTPKTP